MKVARITGYWQSARPDESDPCARETLLRGLLWRRGGGERANHLRSNVVLVGSLATQMIRPYTTAANYRARARDPFMTVGDPLVSLGDPGERANHSRAIVVLVGSLATQMFRPYTTAANYHVRAMKGSPYGPR